tara:strand:+ start:128 stop:679 length:552 start_codon:yes stop_codon:yes gene_type:complete
MQKIKKNIEDILLRFLLTKNFDEIEINEIQKKTKVSSKKFFQIFETKEDIMISFFKRIDQILEKKIKRIKLGNNVKDNLFEICMIKIDLLNPYKKNLFNFYISFQKKPNLFLKLYKSFFLSMENNLKLSKISMQPIKKNLKVAIFSFLYLSVIYDWLKDSSDENEKIMANLDSRLSLVENILM